MKAAIRHAARAYASTGLESQLDSASPHRLIVLLFDGAISAVGQALTHLRGGAIPEKGAAITKAVRIIEEGLKAALDDRSGGEIAQNLRGLYDYMLQRLLHGSLRNDPNALEEVTRLLRDLREAWIEIDPARRTPVAPPDTRAALMVSA